MTIDAAARAPAAPSLDEPLHAGHARIYTYTEPCSKTNANYFRSWEQCGTGAIVGSSEDGNVKVVIPLRCKTWACSECAKKLTKRWIARIMSGHPERFFTLTTNPANVKGTYGSILRIKLAWPKLVRLIRKEFGRFEYAAALEINKSGFAHLHVVFSGTYIPHRWLKAQWGKLAGAMIVDIRAIKDKRKAAAYVAKYVLKATLKTNDMAHERPILTLSRHYEKKGDKKHEHELDIITRWWWTPASFAEVCMTQITALGLRVSKVVADQYILFEMPYREEPGDDTADFPQETCPPASQSSEL